MSNQERSPYAQAHWQRWEMEAFDMPAAPRSAAAEPEPDMETILAEITDIKRLAQEQGHAEGYAQGHQQGLEAGQKQGYQAGFDQGLADGTDKGYKEGLEKGQSLSTAEAARLQQLTQTSATALNQLHEEVGQAVLALAVDIAQHVLQTELREHPDQLLPLIKESLKDLDQSEQAITLLLNPDDVPLVERYLDEHAAHQSWRLKADASIRAGGVEVKTALGHIDATLETRWRRALARLGPSAPHKSL